MRREASNELACAAKDPFSQEGTAAEIAVDPGRAPGRSSEQTYANPTSSTHLAYNNPCRPKHPMASSVGHQAPRLPTVVKQCFETEDVENLEISHR
jgi:hypothetical protein